MDFRTILGFVAAVMVFIIVLLLVTPWILSMIEYTPLTGGIEFLLIRAFILLIGFTCASFVYHLIKGQESERPQEG